MMALLVVNACMGHRTISLPCPLRYVRQLSQHRVSRAGFYSYTKDFLKHVRKLLDETCVKGLSLAVVKAKEDADGDVELGSWNMKRRTEDGDGVDSRLALC